MFRSKSHAPRAADILRLPLWRESEQAVVEAGQQPPEGATDRRVGVNDSFELEWGVPRHPPLKLQTCFDLHVLRD